jgi:superfamily II DNA or RNA helicase
MALILPLKYCLSYQDDYLMFMTPEIKHLEKSVELAEKNHSRSMYSYTDCMKELYKNPEKASQAMGNFFKKQGIDKTLDTVEKRNMVFGMRKGMPKHKRAEKIKELADSVKQADKTMKILKARKKDLSVERRIEAKAKKLQKLREAVAQRKEMEAKAKQQEKERGYSLDR